MALTSLESTTVECFDCEWPLTEWGASTLPVTGEGEEARLAAQHADETGHEVEITTRLSVRKEGEVMREPIRVRSKLAEPVPAHPQRYYLVCPRCSSPRKVLHGNCELCEGYCAACCRRAIVLQCGKCGGFVSERYGETLCINCGNRRYFNAVRRDGGRKAGRAAAQPVAAAR